MEFVMYIVALNQAIMLGGAMGTLLTKMIKGEVDRPSK